MSGAIQFGSLLLPLTLLLVFASAGATLVIGRRLAGPAAGEAERALWRAIIVGLVVARLAFVYEYRSAYFAAPWSILDLRDGGWNPAFGLAGAWLAGLDQARRTPVIRTALRRALAIGTVLFVGGLVALALQPGPRQRLPALNHAALDGTPVRLDQYIGRPTVINLWATWCPPCQREMPVLQAAQAERPDVNFVFLNQGEDPTHVGRWLASQRLELRNVLVDPTRQASAAFKQQGYPTTLFFDRSGALVSVRIGELSTATLQAALEKVEP